MVISLMRILVDQEALPKPGHNAAECECEGYHTAIVQSRKLEVRTVRTNERLPQALVAIPDHGRIEGAHAEADVTSSVEIAALCPYGGTRRSGFVSSREA